MRPYVKHILPNRLSIVKRLLLPLIVLLVCVTQVAAQRNAAPESKSHKTVYAPSYAWRLIPPLGLREPAEIDTAETNYYRESVPSLRSDAWATTGNLGGQGLNMIFSQRQPTSDFFFRDAVTTWVPTEQKQKFYNTRRPMTLLSFNTSGGRDNAQERLQGTFSGNINRRAQVGAMIDYLYSKGSYANQAAKDLAWGLNGSYLGDRFEFQGFFNHYNIVNHENGGITDMLYITDPGELQGGVTTINPKSIPTNLSNAFTRNIGAQVYLNSRYKVGYWHTEEPSGEGADTIEHRTYIPVTSFIWTMDYTSGKHVFTDKSQGEIANFFENTYLNPSGTYDDTRYWTLTNTVGVSLLEGFHRRAKFGLAAYVTHQLRRYDQSADTFGIEGLTPFPGNSRSEIVPRVTQNLAYAGAQLTKQHGTHLRYAATGELGFLGDAAGDIKAHGHIDTRFRLGRDSLTITAHGQFNNTHAPYLLNRYVSNHFVWSNDFGKIRTLGVGGGISYPWTGTAVDIGVTNIQNHIYFGPDYLPVQHRGSVQVFSVRLRQNFAAGIYHWDNTITYQATSDDTVLPLPALAVYSNMYLLFNIATLKMQFGVDCDWYTKYYAPSYQPATETFANRRDMKIGNYPFVNIYANCKLSRARFYVMFSHVNQGLFGGSGYFSMPYYPLNPRRFQLGVSVDFAN